MEIVQPGALGSTAPGVDEDKVERRPGIFPEIVYDKIEKIRGFDVCFVTTAHTDAEAKSLLAKLGMPFKA